MRETFQGHDGDFLQQLTDQLAGFIDIFSVKGMDDALLVDLPEGNGRIGRLDDILVAFAQKENSLYIAEIRVINSRRTAPGTAAAGNAVFPHMEDATVTVDNTGTVNLFPQICLCGLPHTGRTTEQEDPSFVTDYGAME